MKKVDAWLGKNRLQRVVKLLLLVSVIIEIDLAVFLSFHSPNYFSSPNHWTIYIFVAQWILALLIIVSSVINGMLSLKEVERAKKERRLREQEEVAKAELYLSGEMATWK